MEEPVKHVMEDESSFSTEWDGQVVETDLDYWIDELGCLPISIVDSGTAVSGHIRQSRKLEQD